MTTKGGACGVCIVSWSARHTSRRSTEGKTPLGTPQPLRRQSGVAEDRIGDQVDLGILGIGILKAEPEQALNDPRDCTGRELRRGRIRFPA